LEDVETRIDLSMTTRDKTDTRLFTGNKKELRQKTAELLIAFIDIMNNEKNTIDTSYEDIQDRVFKLREREKDLVTDRLKKMTDEERDADTILKINKLGMYSKGMQKGLTTLDKNFYDEEQEFRDTMTKAERDIRKRDATATDENIDILLDEFMEQRLVDNEIDAEANDMEFMNETYYDGNTDGVGAPEEEYDDYQEDM
jgi:DNA-binding protein H-NS